MTHPFDYFSKIYIINLATRSDRRREMAQQLRRIGRDFSSSNIRLFEATRPDGPGGFESIGARGCFMSHLGVLQEAAREGQERILIFEDDLNFSADFLARAPRIFERLANLDWALFYGGHEALTSSAPSVEGLTLLSPADSLLTAHFVAFQQPAIAELAEYLRNMLNRPAGDPAGGPMHVDGAYAWFRQAYPDRKTFVAQPVLGYQRSSRTDIHALRWFDRWPLAREMVAALRRYRNNR